MGKVYTHGGRDKPLDAERLRKQLPKVGDKLIRRMETGTALGFGKPRPCKVTVTYVNEAHLWYEVQFPCGVKQCFKAGE